MSCAVIARGRIAWHSLFTGRRIDRIVFAATKADHLHHTNHDRLEAILQLIAKKSIQRASFSGAEVRAFALASVRVTSEMEKRYGNDMLPCIAGVPVKGERLGSRVFNGTEQFAIFPGDLPDDPALALTPEWLDAGAARPISSVSGRRSRSASNSGRALCCNISGSIKCSIF